MTVTLAADAAATPTEAAAATEACAPMFVLLTGSQPVVISFVQQRALSHARTTPYPCESPPPLGSPTLYPLLHNHQTVSRGSSSGSKTPFPFPFQFHFPCAQSFPVPGVFPLGRRPCSRQRSPPVSLKRRASVLLDRRPVAGSAVRPFWFMCVSFRRSILICECEPECAIVLVCVCVCFRVRLCVRIGYGSLEYLLPVNSLSTRSPPRSSSLLLHWIWMRDFHRQEPIVRNLGSD